MTYPKTILTKKIRRAIFLFLVAVFFIASPILILYTAGYRYDWKNRELKQTGVLSIDVEPNNAQVYLNDILIEKKLPIYLPNRAPGKYRLKISYPGYLDWSKDIAIESHQTTYIKDITLFKDTMPEQILENLTKNLTSLVTSFDGKYLALVNKNNDDFEIKLYNTRNNTLLSVPVSNPKTEPKIEWSPFANYFLVKTSEKNQTILETADVDYSADVKKYFLSNNASYQWVKDSSYPALYAKQNSQILLLANGNTENFASIENNTNAWYVEANDSVWRFQNSTLTNGKNSYYLNNEIEQILDVGDNKIIVKTHGNVAVVKITGENSAEITALPTQQILYNYQTNEWTTWSWWELWKIYDNGNTELLNRTGKKMEYIIPLDQHGVLLLGNENKITGFNPGYYTNHDLVNGLEIRNIAADVENNKIFFWGNIAGKEGIYLKDY